MSSKSLVVALISAVPSEEGIEFEKCAVLVGWGQFQGIPVSPCYHPAFIILFTRQEANAGVQPGHECVCSNCALNRWENNGRMHRSVHSLASL